MHISIISYMFFKNFLISSKMLNFLLSAILTECQSAYSEQMFVVNYGTPSSMRSFEKHCARAFFIWMARFLRRQYEKVDIVFIAHHYRLLRHFSGKRNQPHNNKSRCDCTKRASSGIYFSPGNRFFAMAVREVEEWMFMFSYLSAGLNEFDKRHQSSYAPNP
jgi:hypothetical protein